MTAIYDQVSPQHVCRQRRLYDVQITGSGPAPDYGDGFYYYPCNTRARVSFVLGTTTLALDPRDMSIGQYSGRSSVLAVLSLGVISSEIVFCATAAARALARLLVQAPPLVRVPLLFLVGRLRVFEFGLGGADVGDVLLGDSFL